MKARLSKRMVDEAAHQGRGGCYLWDTQMPGFGVRIYPTGRKSFVVTSWSRGRRRFFTLGPFGKLTPHQAAKPEAEELRTARILRSPVGPTPKDPGRRMDPRGSGP